MAKDSAGSPGKSQFGRFEEAARELACDESEERFDAALRKVASSPPTPKPKPAPKAKPETKKPAK